MEPVVSIFIMAPQTLFTKDEIMDAEDRLEGFARVIHANQDVDVSKPEKYIDFNSALTLWKNGVILADIITKISKEKPDEIYICRDAWDCGEVEIIKDFARFAGIKVIDFDLENIIPNGHKLMYQRQDRCGVNVREPAPVPIGE